jgi:hypothetical protein
MTLVTKPWDPREHLDIAEVTILAVRHQREDDYH